MTVNQSKNCEWRICPRSPHCDRHRRGRSLLYHQQYKANDLINKPPCPVFPLRVQRTYTYNPTSDLKLWMQPISNSRDTEKLLWRFRMGAKPQMNLLLL